MSPPKEADNSKEDSSCNNINVTTNYVTTNYVTISINGIIHREIFLNRLRLADAKLFLKQDSTTDI